jgi:hypothetical protein
LITSSIGLVNFSSTGRKYLNEDNVGEFGLLVSELWGVRSGSQIPGDLTYKPFLLFFTLDSVGPG